MAISREAKKAYDAARYERNKEQIRAKVTARYAANREAERARQREYYLSHRDTRLAEQRQRYQNDPQHAERKRESCRKWHLRQNYGTDDPYPGMPSLTGKRHYHVAEDCPCLEEKQRLAEIKRQKKERMTARVMELRTLSRARSNTRKRAKRAAERALRESMARVTSITRQATAPSSPPKERTNGAKPWTPTPVGVTIVPFKPSKITYLCSAGHPFRSKKLANRHSEHHARSA